MKQVYLLLIFVFLLTSFVTAQEDYSAEAQKKWMEYMTPSEMHRQLNKSEGVWNTTMKMWMAPGAEATESEGTTVNEPIMGGRYMQGKHNMMVMGMPMEGLNIIGFDNGKKEFSSVWIDNMGTGMAYSTGTFDPATNVITFTGKMYDPMSGKDMVTRETYKIVDDNHHHLEMYTTHDGAEFKMMEITFTRK